MEAFNWISVGEIDWAPSTGVEDPDGCILPAAKLYLFTKMAQYSIIYLSTNLMRLCKMGTISSIVHCQCTWSGFASFLTWWNTAMASGYYWVVGWWMLILYVDI